MVVSAVPGCPLDRSSSGRDGEPAASSAKTRKRFPASPLPPQPSTRPSQLINSMSDDPNGVAWTITVPAEDPVKEEKPEAKFPPKGDEELKAAAKAELKEGADELARSVRLLFEVAYTYTLLPSQSEEDAALKGELEMLVERLKVSGVVGQEARIGRSISTVGRSLVLHWGNWDGRTAADSVACRNPTRPSIDLPSRLSAPSFAPPLPQ